VSAVVEGVVEHDVVVEEVAAVKVCAIEDEWDP